MGEAKRRKKLDPNYGIRPELPSSVPTDYQKYSNFYPCFGYVYCVRFKDCEPLFFQVDKRCIMINKYSSYVSLLFTFSEGTVTIETKDSTLKKEIMQRFNDDDPSLGFVVTPKPKAKYKDRNGLSVLPFEFNRFCSVNEYEKTVKQPRIFVVDFPY
jgi:hypothetical protein